MNNLIHDKDILIYVQNNIDKIIYTSINDFNEKIGKNFDYIFYSNYYGINKLSELACIYHYINYMVNRDEAVWRYEWLLY